MAEDLNTDDTSPSDSQPSLPENDNQQEVASSDRNEQPSLSPANSSPVNGIIQHNGSPNITPSHTDDNEQLKQDTPVKSIIGSERTVETQSEDNVEAADLASETEGTKTRQRFKFLKGIKWFRSKDRRSNRRDVETSGTESVPQTENVTDNKTDESKNNGTNGHTTRNIDDKNDDSNERDAESGKGNDDKDDGQKIGFVQRIMKIPCKTRILIALSLIVLLIMLIIVIFFAQRRHKDGDSQALRSTSVHPVVQTSCGLVRGKFVYENTIKFLGIPYASPPMGKHRFEAPRMPNDLNECWKGTLDVVFPAPLCPQDPIKGMPEIQFTEDCLTLDVVTPSLSYTHKKPVVVYVPGLSILGFTEFDMKYQPNDMLAYEMQIVFVTVRYRTGALGFMSLDILKEDTYPPSSGNYGLQDIIMALRWIHTNIHHFGGDADKITVLGHGSSASLLLSLMTSPKMNFRQVEPESGQLKLRTKQLFHRAWLSGGSVNFNSKPVQQVHAENSEFLRNLKCNTLRCVKDSPAELIVAATPTSWRESSIIRLPEKLETHPAIIIKDGFIVKDSPLEAIKQKTMVDIPVVFGAIFHEYEPTEAPRLTSWEDFSSLVNTKLGGFGSDVAEQAILLYKNNKTTPLYQYYSMLTDARITCPIQQFLKSYAEYTTPDTVYNYLVHYKYSKQENSTFEKHLQTGTHGIDIAAIFRQLPEFLQDNSIKSEWLLEATLQTVFYDFVHGKHENYDLKPSRYTNVIDNDGRLHPFLGSYKRCNFWEKTEILPNYGRIN